MQHPTKRAKVMRGIVAPIFGLLAVLSIVLGVLNATVWKPSSIVSAHTNVYGSRYIVTDPGVLNLVDYRVRISVAALNTRKPICVAVGLAKDVRGWVQGHSVQRITGLDNWSNLSTAVMKVDNAGADGGDDSGSAQTSTNATDSKVSKDVDFKDSDLWTNATCQMGLAKLFVNAADFEQAGNAADLAVKQESQDNTQSHASHQKLPSALRAKIARRALIIDLGKNSPEAFVELRWRRHNLPDFATPLYFVGALFILICGLSASVFAMAPHRRRNKRLVASRTGLISVENVSKEEVKISEALAGTLAGIFGSTKRKKSKHKGSSGAHARHGVHARTRTAKSQAAVDSSISVKSGLNSSPTAALDETTVISKDDLQSYFARFASESGVAFNGDLAGEAKVAVAGDSSAESGDVESAGNSAGSSDGSSANISSVSSADSKESAQKEPNSQNSQKAQKSENGRAKNRYKNESRYGSGSGSSSGNRNRKVNRGKAAAAGDSASGDSASAKPGSKRDARGQKQGRNRKYRDRGFDNRSNRGSNSGSNSGTNNGSTNANSKSSKNRKK
ncbi:hypothetical protein ACMZ7W_02270 [Gardnerella vaginalis]|uniref:hypothetical protein n=1 Tax=Gardnerella vaginalis TaxID=2702 RepID=UPI0039F10F88